MDLQILIVSSPPQSVTRPWFTLREKRKSPYSVRIQESTDQKKTPYLDTFHAVTIGMIFVVYRNYFSVA